MNKKVVFFSPLKPVGGIAVCTQNILQYVKEHNIADFKFVEASIHFKSANRQSLFNRLSSVIFDTLYLLLKYTVALLRYRPDVVHVNTSAGNALKKDNLYLIIAKILRVEVVFHYHFGRIPTLEKQQNKEWNLLLKNVRRAKHVIVLDPLSKTVLERNGFEGKVSYIPNPCSIKLGKIASEPIQKKIPNRYLFVGHVIPTKGVYELVNAFTDIRKPLTLEILGLCNDHVRQELEEIARKKDDGKWLSILGNQTLDVVYSKMSTAEALVLPSYTEGFPNVVLEAMALGCPVIATTVGAIPDMILSGDGNPECGVCIAPKTVEPLKEAILTFSEDQNVKGTYASNGKKKVLSTYLMDVVFAQYQQVWNK